MLIHAEVNVAAATCSVVPSKFAVLEAAELSSEHYERVGTQRFPKNG